MNNSGNGSAVRGGWGKRSKITLEDIQHKVAKGSTQNQAAINLGVSVSTLKRRCREVGIREWPSSRQHRTNTRSPSINEDAHFNDDGVFNHRELFSNEMEIENFAASSSFVLEDDDVQWVDSLKDFGGDEPFMDMSGNSTPSVLEDDLRQWVDYLFKDFGDEPTMGMSGNSTPNNAVNSNTGSGPHSTSMPQRMSTSPQDHRVPLLLP